MLETGGAQRNECWPNVHADVPARFLLTSSSYEATVLVTKRCRTVAIVHDHQGVHGNAAEARCDERKTWRPSRKETRGPLRCLVFAAQTFCNEQCRVGCSSLRFAAPLSVASQKRRRPVATIRCVVEAGRSFRRFFGQWPFGRRRFENTRHLIRLLPCRHRRFNVHHEQRPLCESPEEISCHRRAKTPVLRFLRAATARRPSRWTERATPLSEKIFVSRHFSL